MEEEDKSLKRSLSFPFSLVAKAETKVAKQHGGNFSRYVQTLIERDLGSGAHSPLLDLADRYIPARSGEMLTWVAAAMAVSAGNFNQSRSIASLLEALIDSSPANASRYRYDIASPGTLPETKPLIAAEPAAPDYGHPLQSGKKPAAGPTPVEKFSSKQRRAANP